MLASNFLRTVCRHQATRSAAAKRLVRLPKNLFSAISKTTRFSNVSYSDLVHDMGGDKSAFGRISFAHLQQPDHLLDWEVRCHALFAVLAMQKLVRTDGLRRGIEALTPAQYNTWTYYERWAAAMTTLLLERNVISSEELSEALFGHTADATNTPPLFQTGDSVRVKAFRQDKMTWRRAHIRVPGYIYGVHGVVERVCGVHKDPSFLAFLCQSPNVRLYRVRFRMSDVWPESHGSNN